MATRSRILLPLIWVLVNLTHPRSRQFLDDARVEHERKGDFKLSINQKRDGRRALVKVVASGDWASVGGPVLRVFRESDHDEAKTLVRAEDWEPQDA